MSLQCWLGVAWLFATRLPQNWETVRTLELVLKSMLTLCSQRRSKTAGSSSLLGACDGSTEVHKLTVQPACAKGINSKTISFDGVTHQKEAPFLSGVLTNAQGAFVREELVWENLEHWASCLPPLCVSCLPHKSAICACLESLLCTSKLVFTGWDLLQYQKTLTFVSKHTEYQMVWLPAPMVTQGCAGITCCCTWVKQSLSFETEISIFWDQSYYIQYAFALPATHKSVSATPSQRCTGA